MSVLHKMSVEMVLMPFLNESSRRSVPEPIVFSYGDEVLKVFGV